MALFSRTIKTGGRFTCAMPSDRIYLLVFESQPANQLTVDFVEAFRYSLSKIQAFPKGVVITASRIPEFYSNGISPQISQDTIKRQEEHIWPLLRQLLSYPMPTVTLISGQAVGHGFLLALCHDFRIQKYSDSFLCINEGQSTIFLSTWVMDFVNAKLPASNIPRSFYTEGKSLCASDSVRSGLADGAGFLKEALRFILDRKLLDAGTEYADCTKKEQKNRNAITLLDVRNGAQVETHRL